MDDPFNNGCFVLKSSCWIPCIITGENFLLTLFLPIKKVYRDSLIHINQQSSYASTPITYILRSYSFNLVGTTMSYYENRFDKQLGTMHQILIIYNGSSYCLRIGVLSRKLFEFLSCKIRLWISPIYCKNIRLPFKRRYKVYFLKKPTKNDSKKGMNYLHSTEHSRHYQNFQDIHQLEAVQLWKRQKKKFIGFFKFLCCFSVNT